MIKRICSVLLSICAVTAVFGQSVGSWNIYSNYSPGHPRKVVDAGNMVYYVSGDCLYSYNKKSGETIGHNSGNGLSDIGVTDIHRNYDRDYLMIFYQSGNIDLLYDNGDIVNLGDIASAISVSDKSLNGVAFKGDDAYVAAGFGIVKFNTSNYTVVESGVFNKKVHAIAIAGDNLIINTDGRLFVSPLEGRHNNIDMFTSLGESAKLKQMEALSHAKLLYTSDEDVEGVITIDYDNNSYSKNYIYLYFSPTINSKGSNDRHVMGNTDTYVTVDSEGSYQVFHVPDEIKKKGLETALSYNVKTDDGSIWFLNPDGLGHYDGKNSLVDQVATRPMGTSINNGVWNIVPGLSSGNIYFSNQAESHVIEMYGSHGLMSINSLKDGFVTDITPDDAELANYESKGILKAGFSIVEDLEEPETVYAGTWFEGIYKIKDGKQLAKYDWRNMPLDQTYNCTAVGLDIDLSNNLWVYAYDYEKNIFIGVLPAAKRKQASVGKDDWISIKPDDIGVFFSRDSQIKALKNPKNRNLVVVSNAVAPYNLLIYNTNGTIDVTSDDTWHNYKEFVDQDGKSFGPIALCSLAEDKDGALWIGTSDGVIVIHNPASMLSGNGVIERVKVPRNDGTQYADYLLGNRTVTGVAVDNANRKWFSTSTSGVYLVSEDGKEVIANFTAENSGLPADEVTSIACDPNSNSVYMGTRYGLVEYVSDASPAEPDFSDIYAYPNPVRPEYAGPITIKGLMEGSLVKIADIAGNVFYQGRSVGGMATWDGCDASGRRVKTGIYIVFASSGGDGGSSEGAVAKIMVIN